MSVFRTSGKAVFNQTWGKSGITYSFRLEKNALGFSSYLFTEVQDVFAPKLSRLPFVGVGRTKAASVKSLLRLESQLIDENRTVLKEIQMKLGGAI